MALQNLLFLAVLALLPVQLNKFFFINSSYVFGLPLDYRALSIYLSDIAIILFIAVFFSKNLKNLKNFYSQNKQILTSLLIFNLFLIGNNLFREGFPVTTYFSARILIFSLFFIAASQIISRGKIRKYINLVLSISLIWQSAIIIFQFLNQRSQGLWFLGERSFDSSTVSIAHVDIFGIQLLRSYGTFPHPNLAGAFLTLTLIFISLNLNSKRDYKLPRPERPRYYSSSLHEREEYSRFSEVCIRSRIHPWTGSPRCSASEYKPGTLVKSASILSLLAVPLTFSRSTLAVFSLLILISSKNLKSLILKSAAFLAIIIFLAPLLVNTQLASVAERLTLTQASLDIASQNLFFGVGNTNFLTHLASLNLTSLAQTRLIQPVHNVFLLMLAENGIIGFCIFIAFLLCVSQYAKSKEKLLLFTSILIFASVDHFFWTLHQGQILFWLSLAFIVAKPHRSSGP